MTVSVGGHDDARMAHPLLHDLHWQFHATLILRVEQPNGIEMPKGVKARVFRHQHRLAFLVELRLATPIYRRHREAGRDLWRLQSARHDVGMKFDIPLAVGERDAGDMAEVPAYGE